MYRICFVVLFFINLSLTAQDTIVTIDSTKKSYQFLFKKNSDEEKQIRRKQKLVGYFQLGAYSANFASLYHFWYKDYPTTSFHFFDDFGEYLQADKVSHMYGAYIGGRMSMQMWKWAGASRKKYIWLGGTTGLMYETLIEVMDGFSDHWGFSVGDYAANVLGTGLLVGQELAWNEQRITLKYSTHYETYSNPDYERFAVAIDGKDKMSRLFKNYNPQTYWLSCNLKSFFKKSSIPGWLNIAVGYGAENIVGAYHTDLIDANGVRFGGDDAYPRYRQWYLSPDIDLTRVKTKSKVLKTVLFVLNSFKFPAPSLELSQGSLKWNWLHF